MQERLVEMIRVAFIPREDVPVNMGNLVAITGVVHLPGVERFGDRLGRRHQLGEDFTLDPIRQLVHLTHVFFVNQHAVSAMELVIADEEERVGELVDERWQFTT